MRPLHVIIATSTAVAGSAVTLSGVTSASGQTVPAPLTLQLSHGRVAFGDPVVVTGSAPARDGGHSVALESAPHAGAPWRRLATTRVGIRGRYRFRLVPRTSAVLRAVETTPAVLSAEVAAATPAAAPGIAAATAAAAATTAAAPPAASTSRSMPLKVAARFTVHPRRYAVLGGGGIRVAGALVPATGGRTVALQTHSLRGWQTVARGHTGRRGRFTVRYAPGSGTNRRLRVSFGGDAGNTASTQPAGNVSVFYQDVASWYDDAGSTACGFHAGFGVANRTLPCGTRVTFRYGGRTVDAVVDDRGPFIGGRNWDLNQNTAAALGFDGVGGVWVNE